MKIIKNKIVFSSRNKSDNKSISKLLEKYNQLFDVLLTNNLFTLSFSELGLEKITKTTMQQAIEIVRRRIDESGTKEPLIQRQGKDRILVQLPGVDDPERIKRLLGKTAKLTFRFTHPKIDSSQLNSESNISPRIPSFNGSKN